VSYILDALKKAAEQRDVHTPAMRRLFSPDPEIVDTPRWRLALLSGGAAFAGAAVVTLAWLLWPSTPGIVPEKADATPMTTARIVPEPPAPVQPPPPPAPPIVRTAPRPAAPAAAAPVRPAPEKPPVARTVEGPRAADPAPDVDLRRPPAPETATARPQPAPASPPVIASLRPTPSAVPVPTPSAAPTARSEAGKPMRLEVIVYSEERARRLAFINGRKYVEGDTLLDGARVQEIQPNAVVIIEDGRRVVLRP
jgi:Type II secretion system protein B